MIDIMERKRRVSRVEGNSGTVKQDWNAKENVYMVNIFLNYKITLRIIS